MLKMELLILLFFIFGSYWFMKSIKNYCLLYFQLWAGSKTSQDRTQGSGGHPVSLPRGPWASSMHSQAHLGVPFGAPRAFPNPPSTTVSSRYLGAFQASPRASQVPAPPWGRRHLGGSWGGLEGSEVPGAHGGAWGVREGPRGSKGHSQMRLGVHRRSPWTPWQANWMTSGALSSVLGSFWACP